MIKILSALAMLICFNSIFGQSDLAKVFSNMELLSDFTFNYEKDSLSLYSYNGDIPDHIDEVFLTYLLQDTPFDFQITYRNEVLIFKSQPTSYSICGSLKDGNNSQVLPYGSILISNSNNGTESDGNGFFSMRHQLLKNDLITISYIGYKSRHLRAATFKTESCPTILLEPDENILSDEVVIKGYILRDISKTNNYGSFEYDYENFTQRKSSLESDVLRSLQFLPGVSSTDDSATNLNIRGASADHSIVLWENAPLYNPGHMFGMISAINPYVVNQVNLYKDIFHPKYDNRVGSLIDISLNDDPADKLSMGAGFTLTEGHFFLESPIVKDRLSIILSGRNSVYNLFQSQTFASYSETIFQNTKIEDEQLEIQEGDRSAENELSFHDVNAKVNLNPIDAIIISGSYFGSRNKFSYFSEEFFDNLSSEDLVDYKVDVVSGAAELNWNVQNNTSIEYSNSKTQNVLEFSIEDSEEEDLLVSSKGSNNINDESLRINHKYISNNNMAYGLGYGYNVKKVRFALFENSEFEGNFSDEGSTSGRFQNFYATADGTFERLSFSSSLKVTNLLGFDHLYVSPRLYAQYEISDALSLNVTSGKTFQFINQLEEFGGFELNLNGNFWVLKEVENDDVLEATKISLGAMYKKNGWLIDISGYRNEISGLSLLQSSSAGIDLEDFQNGESESKGLDFLINKNWNFSEVLNIQSWLTYSWNQNDYYFLDISEQTFPATIQQEHVFKLVNKINYRKFQLMLTYHQKSGLPYSRPSGIEFSDFDEEEYQINYESINGHQLSDYHRLDLGATFQHKSESMNLELSMSVLNVLDHTNILSKSSFVDENDIGEPFIFTSEKRLLRRTPLLMIRFFW